MKKENKWLYLAEVSSGHAHGMVEISWNSLKSETTSGIARKWRMTRKRKGREAGTALGVVLGGERVDAGRYDRVATDLTVSLKNLKT